MDRSASMFLNSIISIILLLLIKSSRCLGFRVLPVIDTRTGEVFSFQEDFLTLVLEQQWHKSKDPKDFIYLLEQVDSEGYIINDDGQLVPFKVYKKGGSQMCFLHPMNCRGGFHKRHFDETAAVEDGSMYNIKEVYKRKLVKNDDGSLVSKRQSFDQSMDDVYGDKQSPSQHKYNSLRDTQANLETLQQQRAVSESNSGVRDTTGEDSPDNQGRQKVFYDKLSQSDSSSTEDLSDDDMMSRVFYDQIFAGNVADPPPADQPLVRAELVEYPAYEVLRVENAMKPRKRQYIAPPKDFGSYLFDKHRRR